MQKQSKRKTKENLFEIFSIYIENIGMRVADTYTYVGKIVYWCVVVCYSGYGVCVSIAEEKVILSGYKNIFCF